MYAVAARSLEKAQKFARKHSVEKAYGGPQAYQGTWLVCHTTIDECTDSGTELIDDPNVDAVYNPVSNCTHDILHSQIFIIGCSFPTACTTNGQ